MWTVAVWLSATLAPARVARAQPAGAGQATARLELQSPRRCATRADLIARVAARSGRIRFTEQAGAGPLLRAGLVPLGVGQGAGDGAGARAAGRVAVELTVGGAADGRRTARRLTAASCDEAIDALAVMIVVLLDPSAMPAVSPPAPAPAAPAPTDPPAPPAPAAAPAPVAPPAPAAVSAPAATSAPARAPPVTSSAAPAAALVGDAGETRPSSSPTLAPRLPAVWRFAAGAAGHAISGPAPRFMPGVAIDLRVALERPSVWSPSARLVLAHDALSGWRAPGGSAAFTLDSAELDLCPVALQLARVVLRGCGAAIAGRLAARGSDTFNARSDARFFAALGAAALLTVTLGGHVVVTAAGVAGPSATRDSFAFSPAVFYRGAAVSAAAAVGVGVTFP